MITSENFERFLKCSGFILNSGIYSHSDYELKADVLNRRLIYPDSIRGHDRNTSFNANENFVVFECVYRLLKKDYRPEDIELEKEWPLGRTQKSGRADICVYERESDNVLFIIECKTWGKEFDKAMKDTLNDGAQLFSYWQQESSCKWLVLYSSNLKDDGTTEFKSPTINCSDDENLRRRSLEDENMRKTIKLYENAESAKKKYEVWHDTYNLETYDDVIFSEDSSAYEIGLKPLRKRDLQKFLEDGKNRIVNSFEEILRHNNVSDKENAFNRLIALFICKLVDETGKNEDSEVEFQYRHRTDSYESLQDRLQRLYTEGMHDFMHEEITYIPSDYPEKLFSNYNGERRQEAIKDLKEAFRRLKFFTNNDFAFVDVHNEGLFYQNGKILVEVVQLFSKYRIVHTSKHQVLGDLFEQLLDKGFKQNEGQFFTPMPITRFIWDSLPLKRFKTWPRVIDYACGAGHFLTEAVEALNYYLRPKEERHETEDEKEKKNINAWTRDCIFGIEKDYRLARVSKVSMFMNGAGGSNIIFGDGLENTKQIKPGTFDILTANPPYSIASFMQHLELSNNDFRLLSSLTVNSSEIEVLFVERIAQLLASGGIAAVILPSSILSNDSACYTGAREEILQNFMIRSIVQFGSKTFGATGTNTVVMFLERYEYPPDRLVHVKDSVNAILEGRNLQDWEDEYILEGYLAMQGLTHSDWKEFTDRKADPDTLHEYFRMYTDAFNSRKENQKLKDERPDAYIIRFYEYAMKIEHEKILYYALTYKHRTVIILAPSDNAGQKEFLGYDWSSRKGAEGIQYAPVRGGKLYVDANREAEGTLAHVVRQSFGDEDITMTEDNMRYARVVRTCDMIDFSRLNFNKAMRLREQKGFDIESKYPMRKLSSLSVMLRGSKAPVYGSSGVQVIKSGQARGFHEFDFTNRYYLADGVTLDERKLQKGDLLINSVGVGTAGRVTLFNLEGDYVTDSTITIFRPNNEILSEYALLALGYGIGFKALEKMALGSTGQVSIKLDTIRNIEIPLPPMEIQTQIVNECTRIDSAHDDERNRITNCRERIENIFLDADALSGGLRLPLGAVMYSVTDRVNTDELEPSEYVTTDTMLQRCEGIRPYTADLPAGTVIRFRKGDILLSNIRPYLKKLWLADFNGGCSPDVLVFRSRDEDMCATMFAYYAMRRDEFFDFVMQDVKGLKMPRGKREHILDYRIPVPMRKDQQKFLDDVLSLESEIAEAMKRIESLSGKKEAILKKYLQI